MEEAVTHADAEDAPDTSVDRHAAPGDDLVQAVSEHPQGSRSAGGVSRWSFGLSLLISIALHTLLLTVAWALAPELVQTVLLRSVMLFQEGEQHIGDPSGAFDMPAPAALELTSQPAEHPPVELPQIQLPDAPAVQIESTEVQPAPMEIAEDDAAPTGPIGLSDGQPSMNPYLPRLPGAPISNTAAQGAGEEAIVAAPLPIPASVYTPPKVARGFAGRRGLRNGLDGRGLPMPEYPAESRRRGEQGVVELEVTIRSDGTVGNITVRSEPGFPLLVRAAIDALKNARFDPAIRDGLPVEGPIIIPFRFALNE